VDLLDRWKYDAIIADIRLTGVLSKEGLVLLCLAKAQDKDIKVIIMTGYGNPEVMQEVYGLGADFYFEKPVSINIIIGALRKIGAIQ
jgi:DNA-binding NarL/FixJ family response regulator